MKFFNKQKNIFTSSRGFTLIETMVAVLILSTSLASLLSLSTNSLFAARYANNEIIANYLLQEAVDYIRNERDSIVFRQSNRNAFGSGYYIPCSSGDGCYIDVAYNILNNTHGATSCSLGTAGNGFSIKCPVLYYRDDATGGTFYSHSNSPGKMSNFKRKIYVSRSASNLDELDIIVTVEWKNGNLTRTRSLQSSLLDWQI